MDADQTAGHEAEIVSDFDVWHERGEADHVVENEHDDDLVYQLNLVIPWVFKRLLAQQYYRENNLGGRQHDLRNQNVFAQDHSQRKNKPAEQEVNWLDQHHPSLFQVELLVEGLKLLSKLFFLQISEVVIQVEWKEDWAEECNPEEDQGGCRLHTLAVAGPRQVLQVNETADSD